MQVYVSKLDDSEQIQVALKPLDASRPIQLLNIEDNRKDEIKLFKPVQVRVDTRFKSQGKNQGMNLGAPQIPSGGILLNSLKTGMELEGIVQTCTSYAAYVSANVYRSGKAGTFQSINGMLHKVDIIDKSYLSVGNRKTNGKNRGYDSAESNGPEGIISVGTKLKVYVKEVYKQSG